MKFPILQLLMLGVALRKSFGSATLHTFTLCNLNEDPDYVEGDEVDMTDEEAATTSIGCLDETNGICFSGEVDPKNY